MEASRKEQPEIPVVDPAVTKATAQLTECRVQINKLSAAVNTINHTSDHKTEALDRQKSRLRVKIHSCTQKLAALAARQRKQQDTRKRELLKANRQLAYMKRLEQELLEKVALLQNERSRIERDEKLRRQTEGEIRALQAEKEQLTARIANTTDAVTRRALSEAAYAVQQRIYEKRGFTKLGSQDTGGQRNDVPTDWGAPLGDYDAIH